LNDGPDSSMPPRNTKNLAMNNASQKVAGTALYFFGDVRGNENPGVILYHTLFLREHNRQVNKFKAQNPSLNETQLFELGRKWVRAEFQAISETQYFPLIVGPNSVPPYTGYKPDTDPSIQAPFSVAAFRYGHSEGNEVFYRLDEARNVIPEGNALMENVFFDNRWADFGISVLARGMALQRQQKVDATVVSPLRNFLYGQPGAGGFDLVVRNVQRGRDHGMCDFNSVRVAYGLPAYTSYSQITTHQPTVDALVATYGVNGINTIDLYAGGLAEDAVPGANVGPTFQAIIRDQYVRFRDGDRFWWNQPGKMFTVDEINEIKATTLSRIVLLNTAIQRYPCNPFLASTVNNCDRNGIIGFIGAAGSLTVAPLFVALMAVLAFLF
jgi:peroxidase